jgi:formate/nitrite transporter
MSDLSPKEVAVSAVEIECSKANLSISKMIILGFLAGAFIAFGAEAATLVAHDIVGVGLARLVSGMVFSAGLMMVVIAGAELFTGNVLMFLDVLDGEVTLTKLLHSWFWVYFANFSGSLTVAYLVYLSGLWALDNNLVGASAIKIALGKCQLSFTAALVRGILCNWLVCLAVWMAWASKDIVGKIFGIFFPITLFVASNFEHSIANMYYIPAGILAKANPGAVDASHVADKLGMLNWHTFLVNNLVPVTTGNILGAAIFVAAFYWFTYLRGSQSQTSVAGPAPDARSLSEALIRRSFAENCPAFQSCPAVAGVEKKQEKPGLVGAGR